MTERFRIVIGILVLLWAIEFLDLVVTLLTGFSLDRYGIRPRQLDGLFGVPCAPFLHGGFAHLAGNSVPFLVLSMLALSAGTVRRYLRALCMIALIGGLGTWLLGRAQTVHIGASGIVFGLAGYVVTMGVMGRTLRWVVISVFVALLYGGLFFSLLRVEMGISWTGHAFGLVAGVIAAMTARPPRGTGFSTGMLDANH